MTRTNYRVLAYYEDEMYNTECYINIINACSEEELDSYMSSSDLYYEIIGDEVCYDMTDIKLADSILIEGTRIYKDNELAYNKVIDLLSMIY